VSRSRTLTSTSIHETSFSTFFSLQLQLFTPLMTSTLPSLMELDDERDDAEDNMFVLRVGVAAVLSQLSLMINVSLSLQSITFLIDGTLNRAAIAAINDV